MKTDNPHEPSQVAENLEPITKAKRGIGPNLMILLLFALFAIPMIMMFLLNQ